MKGFIMRLFSFTNARKKQCAQKAPRRHVMTISEGFRLTPDHENRDAPSTTDRLDFIFADADKIMRGCRF